MGAFQVSVEHVDDGYQVAIVGELDMTTVPILHEHLAYMAERVVIDCSDLTFIDSTGINELAQLLKRVDSIVLVRPSEILRQVIQILGLGELIAEEISG